METGNRGRDVSRTEGFSDAVFGFAITLLVVSLEVPSTFDDLLAIMRGVPVFAITFALLLLIWHEHHTFFRRFGLEDGAIIWLNGLLLFVVMIYIYPLKFLFAFLTGPEGAFANGLAAQRMMRADQMVPLMLIYGAGFAAVFLLLGLMYLRAWRKRGVLGLNRQEEFDARAKIGSCAIYVGVAVVSMLITAVGGPRATAVAGWTYALIGPVQGLYSWRIGRRRPEPLLQPASPDM